MDGQRPTQPDLDNAPQWRWDSWKVGLDPESLFTTLSEQYNKVFCDIQSPEAFHHDVSSIVLQARNLEDFHHRLSKRREERLRELRTAWTRIIQNFYGWRPIRLGQDEDPIYSAFGKMVGNLSFESIICYADAHIPDDRKYSPTLSNLDPEAKPLSPDSGPDAGPDQKVLQRPEEPRLPAWPPKPTTRPAHALLTSPPGYCNRKPLEKIVPPSLLTPAGDDKDVTVESAAAGSSKSIRKQSSTEQGKEWQLKRGQSQELEAKEYSTALKPADILSPSGSGCSNPKRQQQSIQLEYGQDTVAGDNKDSPSRTIFASAVLPRRKSAYLGITSSPTLTSVRSCKKRPRTPESPGNNDGPTCKRNRTRVFASPK
ncbi:hypothetical protein MCOR22_009772 [Pyricularia oryzae]|nr:hypothetical protein MCOR22_009772 [Pyricularia oryzae]